MDTFKDFKLAMIDFLVKKELYVKSRLSTSKIVLLENNDSLIFNRIFILEYKDIQNAQQLANSSKLSNDSKHQKVKDLYLCYDLKQSSETSRDSLAIFVGSGDLLVEKLSKYFLSLPTVLKAKEEQAADQDQLDAPKEVDWEEALTNPNSSAAKDLKLLGAKQSIRFSPATLTVCLLFIGVPFVIAILSSFQFSDVLSTSPSTYEIFFGGLNQIQITYFFEYWRIFTWGFVNSVFVSSAASLQMILFDFFYLVVFGGMIYWLVRWSEFVEKWTKILPVVFGAYVLSGFILGVTMVSLDSINGYLAILGILFAFNFAFTSDESRPTNVLARQRLIFQAIAVLILLLFSSQNGFLFDLLVFLIGLVTGSSISLLYTLKPKKNKYYYYAIPVIIIAALIITPTVFILIPSYLPALSAPVANANYLYVVHGFKNINHVNDIFNDKLYWKVTLLENNGDFRILRL